MASYEIEHNVPPPTTNTNSSSSRSQQDHPPTRRPDLSTFYSSLTQISTSSNNNPHSLPTPGDVAASYRLLGQSMQALMADNHDHGDDDSQNHLLGELLQIIEQNIQFPPTKPQGLPDEFIEGLERVGKKELKREDECPICGNAFLDDEYPLVVRLPCNDKHLFDHGCIQPWFKLNSTCPLDRKDLAVKKAIPPPPPAAEDEEEEYDDMYG